MPNDQVDPTTIAEFLDERQKSIVVHPNEFLIVVRDGKLDADGSLNDLANWEIIRTEGKHQLAKGGFFGAKTTVLGLLGNGSEHEIEFSTPGLQDIDLENVTARDAPILSQDRVIIPLNITMTIAIDQANATKLFRLTSLRTSSIFTVADFREMIRPTIMANVIAPTLSLYKADDIRGNEVVRAELLAKLQNAFLSYLRWYGIGLSGNQMTVLWGLNEEEILRMKLRRIEMDRELAEMENAQTDSAEKVEAPAENQDPEQSEKPNNPSATTNTGIQFGDNATISGDVSIEQTISGKVSIDNSPQPSGSVIRKAIMAFGIAGGLAGGVMGIARVFDLI